MKPCRIGYPIRARRRVGCLFKEGDQVLERELSINGGKRNGMEKNLLSVCDGNGFVSKDLGPVAGEVGESYLWVGGWAAIREEDA